MTAAHEASAERRRECALARLSAMLPSLHNFVRRQLAYREAVADLAPGAVATEEVIDHVVVKAYMTSTTAADDDIAATVRRLAIDEIHARVSQGIPEQRPTILYFFESDSDGGEGRSTDTGSALRPEDQAEHAAVRRAFENALAGMPAAWRHMMLLRHVDGLGASAVARAIGRSESDVQCMMGHACAYLREQLLESRHTARWRITRRADR